MDTKSDSRKKEIYKMVFENPSYYSNWLDEIKSNRVNEEGCVRNPLHKHGGLIYTEKDELYSMLWHACVDVMQGNYDFKDIPRPSKVVYCEEVYWLDYLNYLKKSKNNVDSQ